MAISMRKYVDITSGVGAGAGVRERDLIGRIFTNNPLLPTGAFIDFDNAEDVARYFGSASAEYARAVFYFGWISKAISRAKKLTFARWANANAAPRIYGAPGVQTLSIWQSITAGAFLLTIGGVTVSVDALNFSTAASLSDVASIIQTEVRTNAGTAFATATVTWDAVRQSFNFVGVYDGDADISVAAGVSNDVAAQLGWLSPSAIFSDGMPAQTLTELLTQSSEASNNFGGFAFISTLTLDQWKEVGEWNTNQNVYFMAMVPVAPANDQTWTDELRPYWGLALTITPVGDTTLPDLIPMTVLAATDYSQRSASQNYMYQVFPTVQPSVTDTLTSNRYDALRLNYYGRTQTAGQILEFYQRGVLTGEGTAPVDMNVYANEIWIKDAASAAIMELFLNLSRVSANNQGRSEIMTALQSVIDRALFNGTISVGKELTTTDKLYITQLTGDPLAWHQVKNIGYWLDVVMQSYVTTDGRTEWKAVYTLIYSKDDAIRKVEGTHILI